MMSKGYGLRAGGAACAAILVACELSVAVPASAAQAVGTGPEWHNVNGDGDETGYSRVDKITPANVGKLKLAWYLDLPGEVSLEAAPIEVDGILYFTGSYAQVYALNAVSGKQVWTFDPKTWQHNPMKMNYGFGANRGAAYAGGKIFFTALDGRLFALDAKTGKMIWSTETTDPKQGQTVTGADRLVPVRPHREAVAFAVRFHIHPEIRMSRLEGGAILLKLPNGEGWRFRAGGGELDVEESIYVGGETVRRTEQLVVRGKVRESPVEAAWVFEQIVV